jgi:hypothetical protein
LLLAASVPAASRAFVFSFFQPYSVALGPQPPRAGDTCSSSWQCAGGSGGGGGGGTCPPTEYTSVDNGACVSVAGLESFGARVVCTSLTSISYGVCESSSCHGCIAFAGDTSEADGTCIPVGVGLFLSVACGPGPALILAFVLVGIVGLPLLACVCACTFCPRRPPDAKEGGGGADGGGAEGGGSDGGGADGGALAEAQPLPLPLPMSPPHLHLQEPGGAALAAPLGRGFFAQPSQFGGEAPIGESGIVSTYAPPPPLVAAVALAEARSAWDAYRREHLTGEAVAYLVALGALDAGGAVAECVELPANVGERLSRGQVAKLVEFGVLR